MIEIKEVKTKKDMRLFASYPIKLYKDCPYYVPSLRSDELSTFNPKKNFSLAENDCKAFLAYKDGQLVGRIAGLINKTDNQITGKKMIRFSRFECIDDIEVFKALLGAVEKYGKENGMEIIHGPWGFNDTDREGMLTFGFDRRSTYATNYYYPYFCEHMQELGFSDESKWIERAFDFRGHDYNKIHSLAQRIFKRVEVVDVARTMSVKQIIKRYGDKLFNTMNEAYAELDGYVPLEGKVIENVLSQFATIANLRYISILVDKDDDVAAFVIVLPSICNALIKSRGKLFPFGFLRVLRSIKKPKELEMALIGVKHKYKNTGIAAVLMSGVMKNIIEDGICNVESNPTLVHNYAIQSQMERLQGEVIKHRQTYTKEIGSLIKE